MVVDGGCAKQTVVAFAMVDGKVHIGVNHCTNPQEVCPRAGMETGAGYKICRDVCGQVDHAEIGLIKSAKGDLKGADVYLLGHFYMCNSCKVALKKANCGRLTIL